MPIRNQIIESIGPARWCLVGSITTPTELSPGSYSAKVTRRFDILSSQIRFAMNAKTILPVVEINTPYGKVTLANAQILNLVPVPRGTPKQRHGDTNELEEFDLLFAKITFSGNNLKIGKKTLKGLDSWSAIP